MEFLQEIGAIAGLAAFLGLAVLALLHFAQARDVRRLRENASFLLERPDQEASRTEQPQRPPASAGTGAAPTAPTAAAPPQDDAEAFRRAELARQAAERRQRYEQRRSSDERRFGGQLTTSSLVVIVIGAALLLAGIGFGASRILGEDEQSGPSQGAVAKEIEIRVLNSTAEPGLAGRFAQRLQKQDYIARSGNTDTPFEASAVMFEGQNEAAAREVARILNIATVEPLDEDVRPDSGGARVVVVIGEDKA